MVENSWNELKTNENGLKKRLKAEKTVENSWYWLKMVEKGSKQ